jgi:hypothetical protein
VHKEELHNYCASPNIIKTIKSRRMGSAGYVTRTGKKRNAYRVLVGKPERKRPLGRPGRRWEDDIKMEVTEMRWDGVDWIDLA